MVKPRQVRFSSRPCPSCGSRMFYEASILTVLTGLYRRICGTCGHKDPERIKIIREDGMN